MTTLSKERRLALRAVMRRTTLTRHELHDALKAGTFPMPLFASPEKTVWREVDIDAWISSRPRVRLSAKATH